MGIESSLVADILAGRKTLEGRLGKSKFLKFRVGNKIAIREDTWEGDTIVKSVPDRAQVVITQLLYFESFEEMLSSLDYHRALPHARSRREALDTYRHFYTVADEAEYGVVAISFKLA